MVHNIPIRERTLEDLFPDVDSFPLCVNIEKGTEVWVASGMLVEYLESFTDAVVVRENYKPIGLVGGYDLLDNLRKNPTNDFFHQNKVEDIMMKDLPIVTTKTPLGTMIRDWKESGRAFAVIPNSLNDFSCISAKFLIKVGTFCKTDLFISQIPKKKLVTFRLSDTIGDIIRSMFENKTRRLVLENTNQFISDRIILGYISDKLNFLKDVNNLMDIPVNLLELEQVRTVDEDVSLDQLCGIMSKMQYPYMIYRDKVFSPWDVCEALMSNEITEYEIPKNESDN
ncbi:MAG: CBS domain-containing protein [Nitrosopumilus sp.]